MLAYIEAKPLLGKKISRHDA